MSTGIVARNGGLEGARCGGAEEVLPAARGVIRVDCLVSGKSRVCGVLLPDFRLDAGVGESSHPEVAL